MSGQEGSPTLHARMAIDIRNLILEKFEFDAIIHRGTFDPHVLSVCAWEGLDYSKQQPILLLDHYSMHMLEAFE